MRPHGLRGQVTLALNQDAPSNLDDVNTLFVEVNDRLLPYFVEHISLKGPKAYLKLEDVDTAEDAGALARAAVYLPKSSRPEPETGFYDDEVVGFQVVDQDIGQLGTLSEVVQAGPNRLLSVSGPHGEVLIPVNAPFITHVDRTRKVISVNLPEGFTDL